MMRQSDELEKAAQGKNLWDVANSTCSAGTDTDGSSVQEIFDNGYELGKAAAEGIECFWFCDGETCFFFLAKDLAEAVATVKAAPDA